MNPTWRQSMSETMEFLDFGENFRGAKRPIKCD